MSAVAPPGAGDVTKEQVLGAYRVMRTIRAFEERLHREFATGEIPGFVHLYAGEEAIAAGGVHHPRPGDHGPGPRPGPGAASAQGRDGKGRRAAEYAKHARVGAG